MGWPQWTWLALVLISLLIVANRHGKAREPYLLTVAVEITLLFFGGFFSPAHAQPVPHLAARYKLTLLREAHSQWGLNAPVAALAAQVHQESGWRPDAVSRVGALDDMLSGRPYDAGDPVLVALRRRAQGMLRRYNATIEGDDPAILGELLGTWAGAVIRPPFHVDYGRHIHFGPGCFVNFSAVFLDVAPIRIGARVQIGPQVQILTADHPRDPALPADVSGTTGPLR